MKRTRLHGILFLSIVSLAGCATTGERSKSAAKKPQEIVVPAGTQSPALGLAFDVSYDPATNHIIPGYHILTVGITNSSIRVVQLNPLEDRWGLVDRRGSKRSALLNLRHKDPDVWTTLPPRLKQLIEYPLYIGLGETHAIDLLFPNNIVLDDFREVHFFSANLNAIIRIYARESTE
ncbi:MAG: hypothetical protein HYV02_01655 [Deltaproteobacteria bacterium]|nr:hypothetical protein [Deltaproteobacteria bacterium]